MNKKDSEQKIIW